MVTLGAPGSPFRVTASVSAGSDKIVANSAKSLYERQIYNEIVLGARTDTGLVSNIIETVTGRTIGGGVSASLMPRRIPLNAKVTETLIQGLQDGIDSALQEKQRPEFEPTKPTADFMRRSGFKTGCKLLIKVVPSPTKSKVSESVPELLFDKFSLQSIAEADAERYQLQETFEDTVLFMFGRRPRVWTMQGIVVNGPRPPVPSAKEDLAQEAGDTQSYNKFRQRRLEEDQDWANALIQRWDQYYRGTRAVEMRARTYISYEDSVIQATLLELTMVRNSQIPTAVNATLTFVVHQRAFVGQTIDANGNTPQSLAQLIEQVNASGANADKIEPAEITPPETRLADLRRRADEAAEKLAEDQEKLNEVVDEKEALQKTMAEGEVEKKEATNKLKDLQRQLEEAEKAGDEEAVQRISKEIFDEFDKAQEAEKKRHDPAILALRAESDVQEGVRVVGNAQAANDFYNSSIENHPGAPTTPEPTHEDLAREIKSNLEDENIYVDSVNIINSTASAGGYNVSYYTTSGDKTSIASTVRVDL